MKYEVKWMLNGKGYKKTVEADNEAMAKQKVLASIEFVSCEIVKETKSNPFGDNIDLDNIFGPENRWGIW